MASHFSPQSPSSHTEVQSNLTTNPRVNELAVGLKRKRGYEETSTSSKAPTIVLPLQIFKPVAPQVPGVNKVALHTSLENSSKVPQQSDIPTNTANSISLSQHTLAGDDKIYKNNQETVVEVECISEQSSFMPPTGRQEVSSTSDLSTHGSGTPAFAPEPQVEGYDEPTSSSETRRTTRTRKKVQSMASAPSSRSSQSRRKASKAPAPIIGDVFSGMTAVALKTLTNANTVRNQQYIAAKLETEVIRKLGCRPTSPTVKVQTVLQRAQDDKARSRRERAQRRAQGASRRYDSEEPDELGLPTFTELDLNARERDPCSDSHRRGAGEDEDYKTPERQLKRLKLTDDPDPDEMKEGRRVKWDRGLFTAVYIDDVHLGARPLSKVPASRKGCLAFASKAVQLDTMGNLPNANTAVVDLVEENITIKKYVYDDDEEEAPPVVKATRSKPRKSKS
ncbi:hypothetical protein F5887DRAFT_314971 [Amanita rubescens]|nr:hypothetical protein F5887DRAFT_314971 [Amanita rubescens]